MIIETKDSLIIGNIKDHYDHDNNHGNISLNGKEICNYKTDNYGNIIHYDLNHGVSIINVLLKYIISKGQKEVINE